ncbi:MAG: CoA transferase [Acidimicrobiales bacterium]|nr:MAG: CoA transferase [Acidimicrobiales bacterium]
MTLSDLRLIDLSDGIAGAYLGRLFTDAGAQVVRVEPADGAALRRRSAAPLDDGGTGPLFAFLAAGTRSVVGVLGDDPVEGLLASAAAVIVDGSTRAADALSIAERHPHIVVASIRAYGLTGPWADRAANDFLLQADSGSVLCRGHVSQVPFAAGGDIFEWTAASYAAPPTLAAIDRAARCGVGDVIDVSIAEAASISASTFADLSVQMSGREEPPLRSIEAPSIEPAADGWVGFNTNTRQQFQSFCLMMDRADLMESEWADLRQRTARLDEWNAIVRAWTTQHSVDEIVERASELRVPVARVNDGAGVLAEPHLADREFFVDHPGGFVAPRSPRLVSGERPPLPGPVPAVGEADPVDLAAVSTASPAAGSADPARRPLEGIRVLDLTSWWAGPSSTQALAALGADVIHLESTSRPDGMRLTGLMFGTDDWWEWGHMFVAANADKRDLTLDLTSARGRELLLRLVDMADLVVENFSPRVIEQFDLDWDVIHERNPATVMVRMPAFGLSGPWRERVGFAQTMEQMSGMAWLTGHPDDQPRIMRGPCDPIAGMHGAFAALLGLRERDATGVGVLIESPMVEAAISCSSEMIVEWTAAGAKLERLGNRSRFAAPQGVYAANGDEEWVAVSVEQDDEWVALASLLGLDPADAPSAAARQEQHDEIDAALAGWLGEQPAQAAVAAMETAGVPSVVCRNHGMLRFHPQFDARGFYEEVAHPAVGTHLMPGQPYRMRGVDRWVRTPSPTLGQHNREILAEIGLGDDQIAALEAAGEIGTTPVF